MLIERAATLRLLLTNILEDFDAEVGVFGNNLHSDAFSLKLRDSFREGILNTH